MFLPTVDNVLQEERRFRYWSTDYKYRFALFSLTAAKKLKMFEDGFQIDLFPRSDIDVVAIRAGCTFVGYVGSNYNGAQMTVHRKVYDRFPHTAFSHFITKSHFSFQILTHIDYLLTQVDSTC